MPINEYHFFINKFVDAIRFEIARSAEKAYESLSLGDAQRMFMLGNPQEFQSFVGVNSEKEGVQWVVQGDRLFFHR